MDNELFVVRSNGKKLASFSNKMIAKLYRDAGNSHEMDQKKTPSHVVKRGKDHKKGETK